MSELLPEITPDNVKEYLTNKYFHHSLCGCKCVVKPISSKVYSGTDMGVYKHCLTHDVKCSATGWELGHYLGNLNKDTRVKSFKCKCGRTYRNKYGMCYVCLKEQPELYQEYYKDYKLGQAKCNIRMKMKFYNIPNELWEEKLNDYEKNYYGKNSKAYSLKEFWKK